MPTSALLLMVVTIVSMGVLPYVIHRHLIKERQRKQESLCPKCRFFSNDSDLTHKNCQGCRLELADNYLPKDDDAVQALIGYGILAPGRGSDGSGVQWIPNDEKEMN